MPASWSRPQQLKRKSPYSRPWRQRARWGVGAICVVVFFAGQRRIEDGDGVDVGQGLEVVSIAGADQIEPAGTHEMGLAGGLVGDFQAALKDQISFLVVLVLKLVSTPSLTFTEWKENPS